MGTIAAGVAKANADHVVIAGHDGGTGARRRRRSSTPASPGRSASPRPSRRCSATTCARGSWSRSTARCAPAATWSIGAILGADEFGFSTAPLIALGCVMMRVCHLNTCPVGVATQDPELRAALRGQARARRELPLHGRRGGPRADGLAGRAHGRGADRPHRPARARRGGRPLEGARASTCARCWWCPATCPATRRARACARPSRCSETRSTWTCSSSAAARASRSGEHGAAERPIENKNRAVGGLLSGEIARRHGAEGLADGHDRGAPSRARPARASAPGWRTGVDARRSRATPTTTSARACRAARWSVRPPDAATLRRRGQRDRRQRRALRRHERAARSSAGSPASASRSATRAW